eukprot:GHVT01054023.1.p1 GENE.GHVT01054023.1~~GHVT01054023.1.p1  ORF type:complete len:2147 (+),score=314.68 GHVT01054023.1:1421-7861(+)
MELASNASSIFYEVEEEQHQLSNLLAGPHQQDWRTQANECLVEEQAEKDEKPTKNKFCMHSPSSSSSSSSSVSFSSSSSSSSSSCSPSSSSFYSPSSSSSSSLPAFFSSAFSSSSSSSTCCDISLCSGLGCRARSFVSSLMFYGFPNPVLRRSLVGHGLSPPVAVCPLPSNGEIKENENTEVVSAVASTGSEDATSDSEGVEKTKEALQGFWETPTRAKRRETDEHQQATVLDISPQADPGSSKHSSRWDEAGERNTIDRQKVVDENGKESFPNRQAMNYSCCIKAVKLDSVYSLNPSISDSETCPSYSSPCCSLGESLSSSSLCPSLASSSSTVFAKGMASAEEGRHTTARSVSFGPVLPPLVPPGVLRVSSSFSPCAPRCAPPRRRTVHFSFLPPVSISPISACYTSCEPADRGYGNSNKPSRRSLQRHSKRSNPPLTPTMAITPTSSPSSHRRGRQSSSDAMPMSSARRSHLLHIKARQMRSAHIRAAASTRRGVVGNQDNAFNVAASKADELKCSQAKNSPASQTRQSLCRLARWDTTTSRFDHSTECADAVAPKWRGRTRRQEGGARLEATSGGATSGADMETPGRRMFTSSKRMTRSFMELLGPAVGYANANNNNGSPQPDDNSFSIAKQQEMEVGIQNILIAGDGAAGDGESLAAEGGVYSVRRTESVDSANNLQLWKAGSWLQRLRAERSLRIIRQSNNQSVATPIGLDNTIASSQESGVTCSVSTPTSSSCCGSAPAFISTSPPKHSVSLPPPHRPRRLGRGRKWSMPVKFLGGAPSAPNETLVKLDDAALTFGDYPDEQITENSTPQSNASSNILGTQLATVVVAAAESSSSPSSTLEAQTPPLSALSEEVDGNALRLFQMVTKRSLSDESIGDLLAPGSEVVGDSSRELGSATDDYQHLSDDISLLQQQEQHQEQQQQQEPLEQHQQQQRHYQQERNADHDVFSVADMTPSAMAASVSSISAWVRLGRSGAVEGRRGWRPRGGACALSVSSRFRNRFCDGRLSSGAAANHSAPLTATGDALKTIAISDTEITTTATAAEEALETTPYIVAAERVTTTTTAAGAATAGSTTTSAITAAVRTSQGARVFASPTVELVPCTKKEQARRPNERWLRTFVAERASRIKRQRNVNKTTASNSRNRNSENKTVDLPPSSPSNSAKSYSLALLHSPTSNSCSKSYSFASPSQTATISTTSSPPAWSSVCCSVDPAKIHNLEPFKVSPSSTSTITTPTTTCDGMVSPSLPFGLKPMIVSLPPHHHAHSFSGTFPAIVDRTPISCSPYAFPDGRQAAYSRLDLFSTAASHGAFLPSPVADSTDERESQAYSSPKQSRASESRQCITHNQAKTSGQHHESFIQIDQTYRAHNQQNDTKETNNKPENDTSTHKVKETSDVTNAVADNAADATTDAASDVNESAATVSLTAVAVPRGHEATISDSVAESVPEPVAVAVAGSSLGKSKSEGSIESVVTDTPVIGPLPNCSIPMLTVSPHPCDKRPKRCCHLVNSMPSPCTASSISSCSSSCGTSSSSSPVGLIPSASLHTFRYMLSPPPSPPVSPPYSGRAAAPTAATDAPLYLPIASRRGSSAASPTSMSLLPQRGHSLLFSAMSGSCSSCSCHSQTSPKAPLKCACALLASTIARPQASSSSSFWAFALSCGHGKDPSNVSALCSSWSTPSSSSMYCASSCPSPSPSPSPFPPSPLSSSHSDRFPVDSAGSSASRFVRFALEVEECWLSEASSAASLLPSALSPLTSASSPIELQSPALNKEVPTGSSATHVKHSASPPPTPNQSAIRKKTPMMYAQKAPLAAPHEDIVPVSTLENQNAFKVEESSTLLPHRFSIDNGVYNVTGETNESIQAHCGSMAVPVRCGPKGGGVVGVGNDHGGSQCETAPDQSAGETLKCKRDNTHSCDSKVSDLISDKNPAVTTSHGGPCVASAEVAAETKPTATNSNVRPIRRLLAHVTKFVALPRILNREIAASAPSPTSSCLTDSNEDGINVDGLRSEEKKDQESAPACIDSSYSSSPLADTGSLTCISTRPLVPDSAPPRGSSLVVRRSLHSPPCLRTARPLPSCVRRYELQRTARSTRLRRRERRAANGAAEVQANQCEKGARRCRELNRHEDQRERESAWHNTLIKGQLPCITT